MARLLLLLAVLGATWLVLRRVRALPPHRRRAAYIKLALGLTVAAVIVLALTGRIHWIGAILAGLLVAARQLLPILIRLFPALLSWRARSAPAGSGNSTVESALLRMRLDHDSGALSGEVLQGRFTGWRLADMDRAQLEELLAFCRAQDADSAQLLLGYLQQRFPGGGWSAGANGTAGGSAALSREEALAVLGLAEGATREDIVTAHRRLMQKLHPDRGGNDYLAGRVNLARDVLLDN